MEQNRELKEFERLLDAALEGLPSWKWLGTKALRIASELYEIAAFTGGPGSAGWLDRGYSILARHFVAASTGFEADIASEADLRQMTEDLAFASHYYMMREYLYYSYNAPGSMKWTFDESRVQIEFADRSIPRQYFTVHNDYVLGALHHFRDFDHSETIMSLLKNEPEGVRTPNLEAAEPLIEEEVDLKLAAYFSLIAPDSRIDLGGYTYEQFLGVYRMLLMKAMYHRYLAAAQEGVGAIYFTDAELIAGIRAELGFGPDVATRLLEDIVFDREAAAARVDASYFSLVRESEPAGRIIMRPHHFAISEGLVNLLRVVAQRRPNTFLEQVSNEIGSAFVRRVKGAWEAEGFICHSEVSLRDFDPILPDIDLLVISVEPTLGYVIFICELKCPVPPRWAKDQLKVLNKDGVSKAFRQVEVLRRFIKTQDGIRLLSRLLPKEGHPHFEGFVVTIEYLIITSDNAGMFFGAESTKVVNFRTLERLLRRSDGDVALIQHVLGTYAQHADEAVVTGTVEFEVGALTVAYEATMESPLLEFPQGHWCSDPGRQKMIDAFIVDGFHPFDVFEHRAPDAVVADHKKRR